MKGLGGVMLFLTIAYLFFNHTELMINMLNDYLTHTSNFIASFFSKL